MPEITPKPLPFLEAIEFFARKGLVVSPDSWRDVWAAQHVQAFTVARVTSLDVLEDIRSGVERAVRNGVSLSEFKRDLIPLLERKGWFSPTGVRAEVELPDGTIRKRLHPWRLDTIYRTNIQSAYQAGRYAQMIEAAADRPYWRYDAVMDGRTRPTHAMMHGKIYRFDHPIWNRWYPPNGYNCFAGGTPVLSASGWKPIETICLGDRIIGGCGDEQRVSAVHRNFFDGSIVRLSFKDGFIDATPNHRILTMRGWMRCDELHDGDVLVQSAEQTAMHPWVGDVCESYADCGESTMPFPGERKAAAMLTFNSQTLDMSLCEPFYSCDRSLFRGVQSWMFCDEPLMSLVHRSPNIIPKERTHCLELLGCSSSSFIVLLGFAKSWMLSSAQTLPEFLSSPLPPFLWRMLPLSLNGVASLARRNTEMSEQAHDRAVIDPPPHAQLSVGESFFDVFTMDDLSDGAPFDRFNSINDFACWARSHCILRNIVSRTKLPYTGNVYNLSVESGSSYIVKGATVHNCRCAVRTLSEREMQRRGLKEQTAGVDINPDPGFGYNPGVEAWHPDIGKYGPEAAELLRSQGVLPPRDMNELAGRLTRMRDALTDTGIPGYRGSMAIHEAGIPQLAVSYMETGEIWLRTDIAALLRGALASGAAETASEVDALHVLVHELGHHVGHAIIQTDYARDRAYRTFSQLVNDIWARNHAGTIAHGLGIRVNASELRRLIGYHNSEYQPWVERFRAIFSAVGVPDAEVVQFIDRLNMFERPERYEGLLTDFLRRHLSFEPEGSLYKLLTDWEAYQEFLGRI